MRGANFQTKQNFQKRQKVFETLELLCKTYPQFKVRWSQQGNPRLSVGDQEHDRYYYPFYNGPHKIISDTEFAFTDCGITMKYGKGFYLGIPTCRKRKTPEQQIEWIQKHDWNKYC